VISCAFCSLFAAGVSFGEDPDCQPGSVLLSEQVYSSNSRILLSGVGGLSFDGRFF